MDLAKTMDIAASGLRAQSDRMRIHAENIANSQSTALDPGGDPYRRQIPLFKTVVDRESGLQTVAMSKVLPDKSEFGKKYDPSHPSADGMGYIKTSNVNSLVESMDMRQAQRSYEANLNVIEAARSMMNRTLDLLR